MTVDLVVVGAGLSGALIAELVPVPFNLTRAH